MTLASRSSLFVLPAVVVVLAAADSMRDQARRVGAASPAALQDTDGDLLPDALEWVLLMDPTTTDSDGDGVDDFVEAVTFELPGRPAPRSLEHEMRMVVSVHRDPMQQEHVVAHILIRIVNGQGAAYVQNPRLFVDLQGSQVGIETVLGRGILGFGYRIDPQEGTLMVLSSRIASVSELTYLLPCSFGVNASIGGRVISTGTLIVDADGTAAAAAPTSTTGFVFQPLDPVASSNKPFWTQAHVCEMQLTPVGGGSGGSQVCQVSDAECTGQPTLRCAPSCSSWMGKVLVVPYGLGFLTGE